MRRELETLHVDIRGVHTDGIFWSMSTVAGSPERLEQERGLQRLLALTHPNDGGPVYALKPLPLDDDGNQKLHLVPGCPQKAMAPLTVPLQPRPKMRVLGESDVPQAFAKSFGLDNKTSGLGSLPAPIVNHILEYAGIECDWRGQSAHLIVENRGGLVTGMPGVGKSLLALKVIEMWKQRYPDDEVFVMAPTHAAARLLPNGHTIQRAFHRFKYGKVQNVVFLLTRSGW